MKIGAMELLVIFIVALLVIGPDKLPQVARRFGNAMREFRKASADVTQEIRESVVDPLEEAQKPLREAMEPLEELERDVRGNLKSVENDLKNIGKPGKKAINSEPEEKPETAVPEDTTAQVEKSENAAVSPEAEASLAETGSEESGGEET